MRRLLLLLISVVVLSSGCAMVYQNHKTVTFDADGLKYKGVKGNGDLQFESRICIGSGCTALNLLIEDPNVSDEEEIPEP